jgi:hypothetical protein
MKPLKLIALISVAILISTPSSAFAKGKPPKDDPPVETTATYTAKLISEDLVFASVTLENLTANSRGTTLSGDFDILMSQENPVQIVVDGPVITDPVYIFNYHCPALVESGPAVFKVVAGNWSINYIKQKEGAGHVYIVMRNLQVSSPPLLNDYRKPDFDFDLHGDVTEGVLFPPEEGTPSVFYLTHYKLWAGVGGKGGFVCNSDGRPELLSDVWLEISVTPNP